VRAIILRCIILWRIQLFRMHCRQPFHNRRPSSRIRINAKAIIGGALDHPCSAGANVIERPWLLLRYPSPPCQPIDGLF
jgi:hypothetical protein